MATRFNLAHPIIVYPVYLTGLALCFIADVMSFVLFDHTVIQFTTSFFIIGLLGRAPRPLLVIHTIALCVESLLFFGTIHPLFFLALLLIAFVTAYRTWLHTPILVVLASYTTAFIAYHLLLASIQHPLLLLYTNTQFCVNVIVLLAMYGIFESMRHAR